MKIILAPDSFKESLSAADVARAMGRGAAEACADAGRTTPALVHLPIADGGEGTVECLVAATGGRLMTATVTGPLGERVEAAWGMLGDGRTAAIEMAAASGLPLVPPDRRDPMLTTTFGTGELIRAALDAGARRILIGIGGSATVDGGVGMAQALGASFRDAQGHETPRGGRGLAQIAAVRIDKLDPRLAQCDVLVACDVRNPLTGPEGAAAVFGPQKGATPDQVAALDAGLRNLAQRLRDDLGRDVESVPGAGAAGGLGAALMALLVAELRPGIDLVLDATRFNDHLAGADLVLTGEGRLDAQSLHGKATVGVARRSRDAGVPCIVIAGSLAGDPAAFRREGIVDARSLVAADVTVAEAMRHAAALVQRRAAEAVADFLAARPSTSP
ncbi:MAG TPA: glycerate kinase [Phycisphaerae bacterium]|nr:glycerate kinase [Phycisphaerae bacterium]HOI55306.1 glycerate kinase [Phycisphaerae bacterium]